jgi:hypothetical protein
MLKLRVIILAILFTAIIAVTVVSILFIIDIINIKNFHNCNSVAYKKTLVVVSAFWRVEMVDAMLSSILNYVDNIDVVIIESESPYSEAMYKMLQKYIKSNLILLHIYTSKNIFGYFMPLGYISGILYNDTHTYENICASDGDVIMYGKWLEEVNRILSLSEVFGVFCSLNPFNNPNKNFIVNGPEMVDYIVAITGIQMVCFKIESFQLMFKDSKIHYQDTFINGWVYNNIKNKKLVRTKENYVVHMTWSIYQLPNGMYKDYIDFKKSVPDLWSKVKLSTLNITIKQGREFNIYNKLAYKLNKYVNKINCNNTYDAVYNK